MSEAEAQAALVEEHKKNCPDGERCEHFSPLKGVPRIYRFHGVQLTPAELREMAKKG
jgi:hypothetical protein